MRFFFFRFYKVHQPWLQEILCASILYAGGIKTELALAHNDMKFRKINKKAHLVPDVLFGWVFHFWVFPCSEKCWLLQNVKPQHKPYPHSCGYHSQGPIDMLSAAVDGLLRLGISALSIPVHLASRGFKHAFDHCINYCHGPFVGSVSYLFMGIEPIAM
jgi:hypothetical protein